ncbi:MAG: TerB family tellurite resistance protein [Deltaproteobacteria bacterium]|nr:TerB family tellurite resistance protein [Deltaproteobacteria bacterium]
MSAAFIKTLPEPIKIWSAKAISGIIVADGKVTDAELSILRESISFLDDGDMVNEIVEMVKDRQKPQLEVLKTDRKTASNILMALAVVTLTDDKLSPQEIQYFNYIAAKLGFETGFAKLVINWGREFILLNKRKKEILNKGEKTRPIYVSI